MLEREQVLARLRSTGYTVSVVPTTGSTNADLLAAARAGAPAGTTLIAETQTAGRGTRRRAFASPVGGLYLSTLLRPPAGLSPGLLTCCAAVALSRAIEGLGGLPVGIKWVNDLYQNGRKVAGILAQGVLEPSGALGAVVLGVGVNLTGALPPELASVAAPVSARGALPTRAALAAAFLDEWAALYAALPDGVFWEEYRRRSVVLGRRVTVVQGAHSYPATAVALTDRGHLRVRTAAGETELAFGEVSLRL